VDFEDFRRSFVDDDPPPSLTRELRVLWHVGRDQWDRAHALIQTRDDTDSCRIHAHLHRLDGDLPNAAYWYARAGQGMPVLDTQAEWEELVREFLARPPADVTRDD
jgi:hypothetical protein